MQLVNHTPVVAQAFATDDPRSPQVPHSVGMVHAKATFELVSPNRAELVTQDPFPLLDADEPTPLGILPKDLVTRTARQLEVLVLGMARPQGGTPTGHMRVGLRIGPLERSLNVYGDRIWLAPDRASEPLAFDSMPLTYEHAFGGAANVAIDADTVLELCSPLNRRGRGFDPEKSARLIAKAWGVPEGYPQLSYQRLLPNLEDPAHPIRTADDEPEPCCWATIPRDIGFSAIQRRVTAAMAAGSAAESATGRVSGIMRALQEGQLRPEDRHYRAHPELILDVPAPGARVRLTGMSAAGVLDFELPQLRVSAITSSANARGCVSSCRTCWSSCQSSAASTCSIARRSAFCLRSGWSVASACGSPPAGSSRAPTWRPSGRGATCAASSPLRPTSPTAR